MGCLQSGNRIGAGTPPILTDQGWLLFYHGVYRPPSRPAVTPHHHMVYSGGAMLLDRDDPRYILWRTPKPLLRPASLYGRYGQVPNVVFPTGVDVRGRDIDVYCGAADTRIIVTTVRTDADIVGVPSTPDSAVSTVPAAFSHRVA